MCLSEAQHHTTRIAPVIDNYASAIPGGEEKRLYWQMTLDFGVAQTTAIARWAEDCIEKLEERIKK